jgi:hypothetical protein
VKASLLLRKQNEHRLTNWAHGGSFRLTAALCDSSPDALKYPVSQMPDACPGCNAARLLSVRRAIARPAARCTPDPGPRQGRVLCGLRVCTAPLRAALRPGYTFLYQPIVSPSTCCSMGARHASCRRGLFPARRSDGSGLGLLSYLLDMISVRSSGPKDLIRHRQSKSRAPFKLTVGDPVGASQVDAADRWLEAPPSSLRFMRDNRTFWTSNGRHQGNLSFRPGRITALNAVSCPKSFAETTGAGRNMRGR